MHAGKNLSIIYEMKCILYIRLKFFTSGSANGPCSDRDKISSLSHISNFQNNSPPQVIIHVWLVEVSAWNYSVSSFKTSSSGVFFF